MGESRRCGRIVSSMNEPQRMGVDSKDTWFGEVVSSRNEP